MHRFIRDVAASSRFHLHDALHPAFCILLCTGLLIRDDLLIRLLKSALKSTDHGMLKSTGHGMLKSTQVANNEISHMVVAAEGRHTMWEGG